MTTRNPYQIVKHARVTEKAMVLENLKNNTSNKCIARFKLPRYVFNVAPDATKQDIKWAVEEIYKEQNVEVLKVNTINVKPKKRRVRGRVGFQSKQKKAYVTLSEGQSLESV
ncbi:MAG: 50S ribosomal protein L23 [Chlamydiia bacterium]|nr:50S ribosomal protein L23 [Chlamydiia bacterium]